MTLGTTHAVVSYSGDGNTIKFNVTFEFHPATDIEVIVVTIATGAEATKKLGVDYSVSGGDGSTGQITFLTGAPTNLERVVIRRRSNVTQPDDLIDGGPLPADPLERRLDILTARLQELEADISRSLKVAKGSQEADRDLNLTGGAGQGVLVSNDELGFILGAGVMPDDVVVSTKGETLVGLQDEAAMRAFLQLGSAAQANVGTSGDVVGKLNANKTDSGANTYTAQQTFTFLTTRLVYDDSSGNRGPNLLLHRNSPSPEANDRLGEVIFAGEDLGSNFTEYCAMRAILENPAEGSEEARFDFLTHYDGAQVLAFRMNRGLFSPLAIGQDLGVGTINLQGGAYRHGVEYARGWTYGAQIAASGTAMTLATGLPNDLTEIVIAVNDLSVNTTGQAPIIQLGTSAGFVTGGYVGRCASYSGSAAAAGQTAAGLPITRPTVIDAGSAITGMIVLQKWDPAENLWMIKSGAIDHNPVGSVFMFTPAGHIALVAELDRVRITTAAGTATFDAGEARVLYR